MEVDGRSFIDSLILASTKDPTAKKILLIGRKYGLSVQDTLAFMAEIAAAQQEDQKK